MNDQYSLPIPWNQATGGMTVGDEDLLYRAGIGATQYSQLPPQLQAQLLARLRPQYQMSQQVQQHAAEQARLKGLAAVGAGPQNLGNSLAPPEPGWY